eukprot:GFKZ01016086.1.p1 GENE.GFKZ01016086.1~~GFKZ01016086.1.p1  ORF type:complete len:1561 (+),score=231.62 GFKZ01016086.1:115-4683(+)
MMLRDADAEQMPGRAHAVAAAAALPTHVEHGQQRFPKFSAREIAGMADKSILKVHELTERNVLRPAAVAAKRVGRLPSLATLAGFGKHAPADAHDSGGGDDGGDGGDGGEGGGGRRRHSGGLGRPRRRAEGTRVVHINNDELNSHFPSNYVSTTKYKPWKAVFQFLIEQFSRFSNTYFLVVGIGYTIDAVSPVVTVGRYSTLGVLAIVILISAVKEAVEDYHRFREDRRVNGAVTHVVGSNAKGDRWANVKVGDILKIMEKEHLPADMVLIASSNDDGLAYIETKQLDGESNLKVKVVPNAISSAFQTDSMVLLTKGRIECETPNDRLYKFNGRIIVESVPSAVSANPGLDEIEKGADIDDPVDETEPPVQLNAPISLGPENLLIRGSSLRNTDWVMGIVVNTGSDTKLMQNVKARPPKNSRLERETNRHYFITLALQICIVVGLTIRSAQACSDLFDGDRRFAWYLLSPEQCGGVDSFLRLFTFFITFSALIPISLYVSIEIVRVFQVYFIEHDKNIIDPVTNVKTEVRTSNLNEELGVIHHVFTDKTGTLTANRMEFKKCSIAGRVYEMDGIPTAGATSMQELKEAMQAGPESSAVRSFAVEELEAAETAFRLLSLCHSVVAESSTDDDGSKSATTDEAMSTGSSILRRRRLRKRRNKSAPESGDELEAVGGGNATGKTGYQERNRQSSSIHSAGVSAGEDDQRYSSSLNENGTDSETISYQASSPDEAALVNAARRQGFTYLSRSNRDTVIDVFGRHECHELLETIEFDSTRKRMSVITRDPDGQVRIYTKGADAIIFERLASDQSPEVTEQHLHEFAVEGLRTLCLAYANLSDEWFEDWRRRYRQASSKINNREEAVAEVVDDIERNLTLLGATAIEDKLQEGVPDTLKKLEQAGVKVWVLTGDKQETAINIGLSCGAIDEGMDVVIINEDNLEDTAAQIDRALGRWSAMRTDPAMERKMGLVIDGQTLHYALEPELQKKLIVVARMARSVIACRVSPKQKTEIVELVRNHERDEVTLAIGDGANDVGMIQAAHVGVGIVGLEGQEAKLASDFSIGQFRFLQRLMLVHGRWNYKRLAKLVLYTIYKNATLTLCELYWATTSAYSGQPLLDPWMGGLYNLFLTSIPPIVLGIFDQELVAEYALAFPEIYAKGQRNSAFNFRVFVSWLFAAIWQSAVIYYVCLWGFGDNPGSDGRMLGMWPFGVVVYSAVIITVHVVLLVYQSSWTKLTLGLFAVSFVSWFIIGPLFSWRVIALDGRLSPPLYAVVHRVFEDARFWLIILLAPVLCVSPSLLWKYRKRRNRPNIKMLVQELLRSGKTREEITGEPQKPLFRVPSYDPKHPGTPSGPVTFHKGERDYQFSGFNFDAGESGAVLRHAFHSFRGVRRKRMRVLRRAGSDTELDVQGVKTAGIDGSDYVSRTDEWVKSHGESYYGEDLDGHDIPHGGRRRRGHQDRDDDVEMVFPRGQGLDGGNMPENATHRRAVSDGAVLVEDRYERLDQRQHDEMVYGGGHGSSSDDDTEWR